jgi:epoxyqueuosine reductase QueG
MIEGIHSMIEEILIRHLYPREEYIFGTADLTGLINQKFGEFRFGISIGKKLDDKTVDAIENGPTLAYYDHYAQTNKELARIAEKIKQDLFRNSIESIAIKPTSAINSKAAGFHYPTLTYDLSHKMVATRAGLGWIGKTGLFISREFGPRLRLVSLLMKRETEMVSSPVEESRCGKCTVCVERCPAQAANGKSWNIDLHRDTFFDAHKCRDKCAELAKQELNIDQQICGICVSVCPIGKNSR